MRAVVQRVNSAAVEVDGQEVAAIARGLLVLLGIEAGDTTADLDWLVGKIAKLRVFSDAAGKMNRDLAAVGGELLVVSQFTLHASTVKGNRPSFLRAEAPQRAEATYLACCAALAKATGCPVRQGVFGADMQVALVNDGPVTILIDSRMRE